MRSARGSLFSQGRAGWGKKKNSQGGAGQEKTCAGRGTHLKSKLHDTFVQIKDPHTPEMDPNNPPQ